MKKIITRRENSNQRIDRFLVKELFSYTRGEIIRSIKAGWIFVNEKQVKPSYLLKVNDEVKIRIKKERGCLKPNKKIKLDVIFKDNNIIVVNKPAGLQAHPSPAEKNYTLINGLIDKFPEINEVRDGSLGSEFRPGIVHRLDKDTSGVMVLARNIEAFIALKEKFKSRDIEKKYLAIVFGNIKNMKGQVNAPIARAMSFKRQKIARGKIKGMPKEAITEFKVLKRFNNFTLVEVIPKTGRMHQIRVHMAYLGHPVVGDRKYAHRSNPKSHGANRQMLHAKSLKFNLNGEKYFFKADIPGDFSGMLKFLTENL